MRSYGKILRISSIKMWFRKKISEEVRIRNLETDVHLISLKLSQISEQLQTLEIKILESKKIYQRKLKNLVEDEEKKDNNINSNVLLGPNGIPI